MKNTTPILAGSLLVLAAALLCTSRSTESASPAIESPKTAKFRHRPAQPVIHDRAPDHRTAASDENAEAANLAAWNDRLEMLLLHHGDREAALRALLAEVNASYLAWVSEQIAPVAELSPAARYDELSDIGLSVSSGTAAIFEQLGIDESQRPAVTAGPSELVVAEIQYAEAAPDSASRLAILRLDREREARMENALALADDAARSQAITELDAWYETGMGGIFATADEE